MARGKNAPALFEVIRNAQEKQRHQDQRLREQAANQVASQAHSDARSRTAATSSATAAASGTQSSAATLLKSPLFWFKGRAAHDAGIPIEPVMREIPPAAASQIAAQPIAEMPAAAPPKVVASGPRPVAKSQLPEAIEPAETKEEAAPRSQAPAYRTPAMEAARQVREEIAAQDAPAAEPYFDSRIRNNSPARVFADPAHVDEDAGSKLSDFSIDHDRRQITLRLSYTNAIVAAFALLVACCLAYVIGSAGRGKATIASSELQPNVLNISPGTTPVAEGTTLTQGQAQGTAEERANVIVDPSEVAINNDGHKIDVPTNIKRIVGYQYLVVMSFPPKSGSEADKLVKFLADNGVAATSERALPGYSPTWFSVVTTRGFDHTSKNPQYDVFVASLGKLMQKYSLSSRYPASKTPAVYTWHTAN